VLFAKVLLPSGDRLLAVVHTFGPARRVSKHASEQKMTGEKAVIDVSRLQEAVIFSATDDVVTILSPPAAAWRSR